MSSRILLSAGIIQKGVEPTGVEVLPICAFIIALALLQPAYCFVLLCLIAAENIVFNDIIQVSDNGCAACSLGMEPRNDTGNFLISFIGVFMIQKELVRLSVDNNSPLAAGGENMQLLILKPTGYAVFLAKLIHSLLLLAELFTNCAAAVAHTVAGHSCFFWGCKLLFVFFVDTANDPAVGKMEYFPTAFRAVKYHESQHLFSVCMNYNITCVR